VTRYTARRLEVIAVVVAAIAGLGNWLLPGGVKSLLGQGHVMITFAPASDSFRKIQVRLLHLAAACKYPIANPIRICRETGNTGLAMEESRNHER
jgi:hypothetical protein